MGVIELSQVIALEAIPNQNFSIRLGTDRYNITIHSCNGIMAATIDRNNERILSGQRIVAGAPLIPYKYLEEGNFIFLTENEEIPEYSLFGSTQTLLFFDAEELAVARAGQ